MNKHRTLDDSELKKLLDWVRQSTPSKLGENTDKAIEAINDYINQKVEETEKAFGGCKLCYGKGYATVNEKWVAHDTDQDIGSPGGYFTGGKDFAIKYCTCDRGKQLETLRKSL